MKQIQKGEATFYQMLPLLVGIFFTIVLDETVTTMVMPRIQSDLKLNPDIVQWFGSAYFIANAAFAIPMAHVGDLYGYRRCMQIFFIIAFISQLSTFLISNFYVILVMRFITGVSYAGINSSRNTLIALLPQKEHKKKYMFNTVIINNSLSILIPTLGGVTVQYAGWKWIYFICMISSFIMILISFLYQDFKMEDICSQVNQESNEQEQLNQENKKQESYKFDLLGTFAVALGMLSFCLGFTMLSQKQYIYSVATFSISMFFFLALKQIEKDQANPILPPIIFKKPIGLLVYLNGQLYFITTCYNWILPQILTYYGRNQLAMGIITAIQACACMISSIITPQLNKKVTTRLLFMFSYILLIAGILSSIFAIHNVYAISTVYICTFLFFGSQMQLIFVYTILVVPSGMASTIAGIPTCSRTIGQSISLCLFTMIQQLIYQQREESNQQKYYFMSFQVIFIIMSLFLLFGIYLSTQMQKTNQEGDKKDIKCLKQ